MKNVKRPLTKPAMMTKFLPKILLSWADQWQRQQWRQNSSQRSFWRSLSIIQNVERPLQALSVVSQSFEWCSVPPTWQKQLKMVKAGIIYHMLIDDRDWGLSILVNGILYFRLFGHLEMTSSKNQNVKINFDSGSNLHRAHGDTWFQALGASLVAFRRFPKGFKSPRETHRSPSKHFFEFKTRENTYRSEKQF